MTSFLIICRNAYILTLYKNNCKEIKLSVKARDTHPLNLEAPRYQRLSLFRCRIPLFGRSRAGGIGFLDRLLPAKSRRAKQFHSVFSGQKISPLSHFRVARSLCCLRSPSGCGHSMAMCLRYSARSAAGLRPLPFSLLPSARPCAPPLRASERPPVLSSPLLPRPSWPILRARLRRFHGQARPFPRPARGKTPYRGTKKAALSPVQQG